MIEHIHYNKFLKKKEKKTDNKVSCTHVRSSSQHRSNRRYAHDRVRVRKGAAAWGLVPDPNLLENRSPGNKRSYCRDDCGNEMGWNERLSCPHVPAVHVTAGLVSSCIFDWTFLLWFMIFFLSFLSRESNVKKTAWSNGQAIVRKSRAWFAEITESWKTTNINQIWASHVRWKVIKTKFLALAKILKLSPHILRSTNKVYHSRLRKKNSRLAHVETSFLCLTWS